LLSRLFYVLLTLFLAACTVNTSQGQRETAAVNNPTNQIQNSNTPPETKGTRADEPKQKNPCLNIRRPLNPSPNPKSSETALDRYFRLAYDAASAGEFNTAVNNYRKAAEASKCKCDRAHAQAGERAAKEAQELVRTSGAASKPTQFFWHRLQELTESLPCITIG
jgi:hypothetical protein